VLVTGGAGFIGSHLVPALVASGADVTVVDSLERGSKDALQASWSEIAFHQLDLLDKGAANHVCAGRDIVVHRASKVGGIGYYTRRPFEVFEANVRIDGNVLGAVAPGQGRRAVHPRGRRSYLPPGALKRSVALSLGPCSAAGAQS
jgi:UDP-glucose 4-epimerase